MEKVPLLPLTLNKTSEGVRPPVSTILDPLARLKLFETLMTKADPATPLRVRVELLLSTKLVSFMTYFPKNGLLLLLIVMLLPLRLMLVGAPEVTPSRKALFETVCSEVTPPFSNVLVEASETRKPPMIPLPLF